MSAAPDGGVNELRAAVTSLCSDYGTASVEQLLARGQRCLQHADALLDQRPSTAEHRHILTAAGWAGLLLACVYHDRGDTVAGERLRGEATGLGDEVGEPLIVAWGSEIEAWMALTRGEHLAALAASERGLHVVRGGGVAAQLHAQAAKAWARYGDLARANDELSAARDAISAADPGAPSGPGHFHVDAARIEMHAMECLHLLGEDEQALTSARRLLRASATPAGKVLAPMPYAAASMVVAVVLARRGDTAAALQHAAVAARGERRSLPSLLMLGTDLVQALGGSGENDALLRHLDEVADELFGPRERALHPKAGSGRSQPPT